jgi:epoxyqueuosine reductase QueG
MQVSRDKKQDHLMQDELTPELRAGGFNTAGVLAIDDYNALVERVWRSEDLLSGARSAVLLGCGGPDFFQALRDSPEWAEGIDPADRFARRIVDAHRDVWIERGWSSASFLYADCRDHNGKSCYANFAALAIACGLGVPSRLGILLHPTYGPWWAIRALLLTERALSPTQPLDWLPCDGCPAPCAEACPSEDVVLPSGFDIGACFETRAAQPACRTRCSARRACVVGRDELAYQEEAEVYYTQNTWESVCEETAVER